MKHANARTHKTTRRERLLAFAGAAFMSATTLFPTTAQATQVPISDLPLFLGVTVRPNVFFQADDSGSMDWESSVSPYWHACAYDSNAPDRQGDDDCLGLQDDEGLFNGYNGSNYRSFRAMFDTPDAESPVMEPNLDEVMAADWRVFSPDFNKIYFDPEAEYEPWPGESDQPFNNAGNQTGHASSNDERNLAGFKFVVWEDDRGFSGSRPHRGFDAPREFAGVNTDTAQSGTHSAFVNGDSAGMLATEAIDASGAGTGTLDMWIRKGDDAFSEDPDGNEDFVVEYRSDGGAWVPMETFPASAPDGEVFTRSYSLPGDALHADTRFRFRILSGDGPTWDFWHFDDVEITVDGATVFSDDFETGDLQVALWGDTSINATGTPNGIVDLWDSHKIVEVGNGGVTITEVTYNPDETGLNPSTTVTTNADVQAEFGMTLAELQQNIANWYAYSRRRSFVAAAAIGSVLENNPNFRYGLNTINDDEFVEVPTAASGDFTSHNDNLFAEFKDEHPGGGTPLRRGLERVGEYFSGNLSGTDDPIVHECQKNFAILMSDGFWNGGDPNVNNDVDGDGFNGTLADVARHYYETDLSPLPNEVPPDPADPADWQHMVTFSVAFGLDGTLRDTNGDGWPDPALTESDVWGAQPVPFTATTVDDMWHAAFNSKGKFIAAQTPQALNEALNEALATVAERESSAAAVAVNSGSFQTGSKLFQARFNSLDWSGNLLAFGLTEITSPQNPSLKLVFPDDTPLWEAADLLDNRNPGNRDLITFKPSTEEGIPFEWPANESSPGTDELDPAQINALNLNPDSNALDGLGQERLQYLRGDRSLEASNGGVFRNRSTVLGDLVNSAPVFVGDPNFLYPEIWPGVAAPETSYSAFVQDKSGRTPMVYVGGNDGMLHGFNADTGEEVFAFVPDAVFDNLNELTSQDYSHRFFVDGSPTYVDVFFNNAWHSVLASGLRKGGQAVFALDVTDPPDLNDNNAEDVVLWEFGDSDTDGDGAVEGDPDMGYSFSAPSMVRLQNGQWGAVFGNGYNNTEADGSASSTGNAVLFIVDVETGELIRKIDTGVGAAQDPTGNNRPNGLASPAVVDTDGDSVADLVFAGDLFGNLWKFDLTDSNPSNWGSFVESGNAPAPMFTAESPDSGNPRQPITSRPQVGRHPAGLQGLMVYFGTGKYIGSGDNTQIDQDTQTFYAVWDRVDSSTGNQNLFDRGDLLEQTIDAEVSVTRTSAFFTDQNGNPEQTDSELRVTSNNDIPKWFDGQGNSNGEFAGWFIDLIDPDDGLNHGEKAVTNPRLRGDRVIFTTLIPSDSPCQFGGDSWLMELATEDGGRLGEPPFDLNDDAAFGSDDKTDAGIIPSGIKSRKGIFSEATILQVPTGEVKLMSSSSGEISAIQENPGDEDSGRQSWEELK